MLGVRSNPRNYKIKKDEEEQLKYICSLTNDETLNFIQAHEETDFVEWGNLSKSEISDAKNYFHKMNPNAYIDEHPEITRLDSELTFAIICGKKFAIERFGEWIFLVLISGEKDDIEHLVSLKKLREEEK